MAELLRFRLRAASRRVAGSLFHRGEGPTVLSDSLLAAALRADPAWDGGTVIRGSTPPAEVARQTGEAGLPAAGAYQALRSALEASAARSAALPERDRAELAGLIAAGLASGALGRVIDAALLRDEVAPLLGANEPPPPLLEGDGFASPDPGDLDEDVDDLAAPRAALAQALATVPVPTAAELVDLADAAGYPSVADARAWKKARVVQELDSWLAEFPPA